MNNTQAKEFVKGFMDKRIEKNGGVNVNDLNDCIEVLRNKGFYIVQDGTKSVIGDIMLDLEGEMVPKIIGEIK